MRCWDCVLRLGWLDCFLSLLVWVVIIQFLGCGWIGSGCFGVGLLMAVVAGVWGLV